MNTVVKALKLTDKEKDEILKEVLGPKYHTSGNNLPILKKVIGHISDVNDAATFAEIIPALNTALANSRIFAFVSSGASILSIVLFPVGTMISIINAYQLGAKMYSYRAIAYTITAWAFNRAIPTSSPRIMSNSRNQAPVSNPHQMQEKIKAWKKASDSVLRELNNLAITNKIPKDALKLLIRAMADNNEQKLCALILKGYEKQFSDFHSKAVWKSNYKILFPQ